ncbi:MAG TPA: gephyrin-like molybdotransferase Glp [Nitrococcus sp.]|nr:gephyrin-like molybdotransferase Glp [Nitrococcus sp.]
MNTITGEIESHGCGHDGPSMSVDEARRRVYATLQPLEPVSHVPIRDALNRVLAEDVYAAIDVPGHANSAMDGYALRACDLGPDGAASLVVIGRALAGHPFDAEVGPGECVRIMTGGMLPAGADIVVMQEQVRREGDRVWIEGTHRAGENVRPAGEDVAKGTLILHRGRRLRPADLGLLAEIGRAEITVYRRPRAAFFSTGDELRSVGEPLGPGEIYDSNRYTLYGMLARLGVEILDLGVVRDDRAALAQALDTASASADVVITSGGVSVGEADYVTKLLAARGAIEFWTINIKPGRPLAFGRLDNVAFFGLPGNPVSAMVTFYQVVQPALLYLEGEAPCPPMRMAARCAEQLRKKGRRREYQRGILSTAADGALEVRSTGAQGSGILRSMSKANCFIVLAEECTGVAAGEWVTVEPFAGLV